MGKARKQRKRNEMILMVFNKRLIFCFITLVFLLQLSSSVSSSEEVLYRHGSSTPLYYRNSTTPVTISKTYNYRTQEFRAVWAATVLNIDMPRQAGTDSSAIQAYKNEFLALVNQVESLGMNVLIFQVRPQNDAFYSSDYNYWSEYLVSSRAYPGWDPMKWMIDECHRRGIEFHAWINPYRVAMPKEEYKNLNLTEFAKTQHPRNAASNPENLLEWYHSDKLSGVVMNPGKPEVRDFIATVVAEIIENYKVDAIHMDDYFYYKFDAASGTNSDNRLDDGDYQTFLKYRGSFPNSNSGISDWRREQTRLLVEKISQTISQYNRLNNQAVQFGISPTGIWKNGTGTLASGSNTDGQQHYQSYLYADSKLWVESGWLDYILPQTYWGFEHNTAPYADLIDWWVKVIDRPGIKTNLYASHALYYATAGGAAWGINPKEVENQLRYLSRYNQVKGSSFYNFSVFKSSSNPVVSNGINTLSDYWRKKVPGPSLQRYPDLVLQKPAIFTARNDNSGVTLKWSPVTGARGYMLYRVPKNTTVNFNKYDHLLKYISGREEYFDSGASLGSYDYYIKTVSQANNLSSYATPSGSGVPSKPDGPGNYTYGDLNGDGYIDIIDVVLVMRHVLMLSNLPEDIIKYADVNGDGDINVIDVTLIMRRSLGLISRFPLSI